VEAVVLVELVLLLGTAHRRWLAKITAAGACSGARRAGDSPRGGSIGVGWRRSLLLVHAVVLVELVLLLGEGASALVGDGDRCWWLQWCSSVWCSSSERRHRRGLAKVAAAGGCSGALGCGSSPRVGIIGVGWRRCPLLGDAVALVELVLLLEGASALVGDGDCRWCMPVGLVELVFVLEEASALVGEGGCRWWMQWCSSSRCFSWREHRRWLAMVTAACACSGSCRAGASPRGGGIGVGGRW
jgi:hypothetical protein